MINTLIIEDEERAADRLEKLLNEADKEIYVLAKLDSIENSVNWLKNNPNPDLIMLDIQLADGLSFDIFKQVMVDSFVIFTTAYDEYAIKAFELNSVDYLLKPINQEKLQTSIEKYKKMKNPKQGFDINSMINILRAHQKSYKKRFMINIGNTIKSIETNKIAYFFSMKKNSFLCTKEGKNYATDFSLDTLEDLLNPEDFYRINRQYIIAFTCIQKIHVLSKSRIKLEISPPPQEELYVSSAKTHNFRLWLDGKG